MEEILQTLTDAQLARFQAEADREGISIEELASRLFKEGVNHRYLLPISSGVVVPLEGLIKAESER